MTIRKYCLPGDRLPRFYGIAWTDYQLNRAICYPIPVNWFAWALAMAPASDMFCVGSDGSETTTVGAAGLFVTGGSCTLLFPCKISWTTD